LCELDQIALEPEEDLFTAKVADGIFASVCAERPTEGGGSGEFPDGG